MARELRVQDAQCSIAQAAAVVGDWWSLLVVREVARGHRRFDELLGELGISRKVLTERLRHLVEHGVLAREPYQAGPVRHEYVLTDAGWALAPVLITMQDWADRWLLGDGSLTGVAEPASTEAARVHALLGTRVPAPLFLPSHGGASADEMATGTTTAHRTAPNGRAPGVAAQARWQRTVRQRVGRARRRLSMWWRTRRPPSCSAIRRRACPHPCRPAGARYRARRAARWRTGCSGTEHPSSPPRGSPSTA